MSKNIEIIDTFDGDKLLTEYDTMSLEDVVSFLGPEKSNLLNQRIKSGTVNLDEISQICNEAFPLYPQRANWLKGCIYGKLSVSERLKLEGANVEQIQSITKMNTLKEKVYKETLTSSELRELCDITFENDSNMSFIIFNALSKITQTFELKEYRKYREQLNSELSKEKDNDTFLISTFTILEDEPIKCEHLLQEIVGKEKRTIMSKTFELNELFQQNMLEAEIVYFAERNILFLSSTSPNTEKQNSSNYKAISENNTILSINNINPEYADIIKGVVDEIQRTMNNNNYSTITNRH